MAAPSRLAYRLTRQAERERHLVGLSDRELAEAAKVSETTVRNARHRQVGLAPARRIVTALGADSMRDATARGWLVAIEKDEEA